MNIRFILSSLAFLLLWQTNLCAQKNLLELIPRDALFVGTLHASSIEQKVGWKKLGEYAFVEEMARELSKSKVVGMEDGELFRSLMMEPQSKGLDLMSNSYIFVERAGDKTYISIAFRLNDPAKFKTLVEAYYGEDISSVLQTKGSYLTLIKDNIAIAWQQNHAFLSFVQAERNWEEDADIHQAQLKLVTDSYADKICSLSDAKSYNKHGGFNEWEKTIHDAGFWIDYKQFMKLSLEDETVSNIYGRQFSEAISMLVNSYGEMNIGTDLSFEKGEIKSETRSFIGPDMMKFSATVTKNRANKRIMNYIDGTNTSMYTMMALSPEGFYEGWKNLLGEKAGTLKPAVDDLFGIAEIFIDEKAAFNFLKGDIFYAINGVKTVESKETDYVYNSETDEYDPIEKTVKRQIPLIVGGFSYGNKEDMMKFIRIISKSGFLKEEKKNVYKLSFPMSSEALYIRLDKGLLVMGNDEERLLNGKKYRPMSKAHKGYMKTDFHTSYVNIGKLLDMAMGMNPTADEQMTGIVKNIKDGLGDYIIHSYRPKVEDKSILQEMKLDLKNKEENALKQIFDFANRLYLKSLKGI